MNRNLFGKSIYVKVFSEAAGLVSHREKTLAEATRLAAEQVDANKIDGWLENGADASYDETYHELESIIRDTPYLQYLYVYQIREDGCHVVFDLETPVKELKQYDEVPEVDPSALGTVQEFDKSWMDDVPVLLRGGRIGIKESKGAYGWLLTCYEPIYDSAGRCTAYVGGDISMKSYHSFVEKYLSQVAFIAVIFLTGCILISIGMARSPPRGEDGDASAAAEAG